ncbi:MAG: methylaspartate mutase sigma subunit [Acidobacteriota bacterium]|jgi:methylaspartate mutase epsilon subunit|nr:methylaspartate mutase sigma subunit [Acidobacteriota bacterium]
MKIKHGHTILLGGIGGDSHSVGLSILRQSLLMNNYRVHYMGTQNRLEDFIQVAGLANVVMISSMDGHSRYYLREFPKLLRERSFAQTLWYLGGNLHIGNGSGYEKYFLEMGFNQVFVKFVDICTVLQILERDLKDVTPMPECSSLMGKLQTARTYLSTPVTDDALESDMFERGRREVLESWKTGYRAKDLSANAEFLGRQPSFAAAQALVNAGRAPALIQPRAGVPLPGEQLALFKAFKRVGVRVLSYQVDSLTRNNNYAGVEEALRENGLTGNMTINGFPVVNHGVPGLQRIISEVGVPLQTRHSTRDPRLLAEISYAGGVTSFEGGAICYNIPYYKDYQLDESIKVWQYVDRLTGLYYERFGIRLDREFFGTLTATLIPPSLAIVVNILEAILALRQGVRCVSLGYAEQGHRIQDIAAMRMLRCLAEEIIRRLGYQDVQVNTVFQQYMAAFPESQTRAEELIHQSAITASLSGATRMIVKTPAEASGIPGLEDNLRGISLAMSGAAAAHTPIDETRVAEECSLIRREVEAILESLLLCGRGSVSEGIVEGFRRGFLDIPFSPSVYNRGAVMTARDRDGAVRFLSLGNLQLGRELQEFHRSKMDERRRAEGLVSEKQNYLLVEQDVLQIPRCLYECWPLSGFENKSAEILSR